MTNSLRKKMILCGTALLLALPCTAFSQISISKDDFLAMKGRSFGIELSTTDNVAVNVGTANNQLQMWDFTAITIDSPFVSSFDWLDPAQTPAASEFTDANLVLRIRNTVEGIEGSFYSYLNVQDNAVVALGSAISIPDTTLIEKETERFTLLPVQFGMTWSDTSVVSTSFPPFFSTTDSTISYNAIDAWGQVKLPGGTFDCLRISTVDTSWSISNFNGVVTIDTTTLISYNWISKVDLLVAQIESQENETNLNFTDASTFMRATQAPTTSVEDQPGDAILPTTFDLAQNFPNPFNPETQIRYSVGTAGPVELAIFDLQGRLINTLVDQDMSAGSHSIAWDGTDAMGAKVASGRYIYRLKANGVVKSKMMVMVK